MGTLSDGRFRPGAAATRAAAARVLAHANQQVNGVPFQPDAFTQAVAAGWITAGDGPRGAITQLEFDRGHRADTGDRELCQAAEHAARRRRLAPATAQGVRRRAGRARQAGGRWNVPFGADNWETWPRSHAAARQPGRAGIPARSPVQLVAVCGGQRSEVVTTRCPAYPPLKKAVLGFASGTPGAPYIWGGSSADAADPVRLPRRRAASTARASCGG